MKRYILFISLLVLQTTAWAQKEDYIWAFGKSAGLNFNSGTGVPVVTAINSGEASAEVCTRNGQLLFYTDGSIIWDRNGTPFPNANPLIVANNTYSVTATSSTSQGAVIVSMPDSGNKYYLFSLTQVEETTHSGYLYYTVVDMTLNGGLGDAVSGRRAILIDTGLGEKMTAVVGDNCNVWLIVHSRANAQYKAYEITNAGIASAPVISNIGTLSSTVYTVGYIKASHNRKRIVMCNVPQSGTGGLEILDFDPATGILSNAQKLSDGQFYGAAFSPDDSKLYVTGLPQYVSQYNLSLTTLIAIQNSKYQLGQASGGLKTGPDGKIYCALSSGNTIGVVPQANVAAPACGYNASALSPVSGTSVFLGLPSEPAILVRDTVTTKNNYTACFKNSFDLNPLATGWNYLWDNNTTNAQRTVTNSGTYIVSYYTPQCTYHVDTFTVRFSSPLPATGFRIGCKGTGDNYLWVDPVSGDTTVYTYTWTDASGNTLQKGKHTGSDTLLNPVSGIYNLTIGQSLLCDTTLSITMPPASSHLSFTVDDSTACTGQVLHFLNTSSLDVTSAAWDFGDTTTSMLPSDNHAYTQMGIYKVRLIGGPCPDTAYAHIQVDPVPQITLPGDTMLCYSTMLLLRPTVLPTEYTGYTYKWTPANSVTNSAIATPTFVSTTTQNVKLTVTTLLGCAAADSLTVTVHLQHFMKVNDTAICPLDTVILHASGATSYRWQSAGMYISDTIIANPRVSPDKDHYYAVWGNDTTICIDTAYAHVAVFPAAVINAPDSVTIYTGEQTEARIQTNCLYVSWFPNIGLSNPHIANPVIQPDINTKYIITGTTENGCSVIDTMDVLVNDGTVLTLPNAFVPGNGPNNLLKPIYRGSVHLNYFRVFNRWGVKVYESNNLNAGWDGMYNDAPQPVGVYVYIMEGTVTGGALIQKQGNVTLLR